MRSSFLLLGLSFLTTLTSACIYPRSDSSNKETTPEFTYDGETGPLAWHLLPNNTLCGTGRNQSPINISPKIPTISLTKSPLTLSFPKYSSNFDVENNGHTILFTPEDNENYTSILGGKKYKLLQFHFHTPSEHRFLDKGYPLEAHFVHQDEQGKLAVVGVFFELAYDWGDRLLMSITPALKNVQKKGDKTTIDDICFKSIMSVAAESKVYTYAGSLTTPPCSEGVTWYVVEQSLSMSVAQFQAWTDVMKFNSRNTQNEPGKENLITIATGKQSTKAQVQ